MSAGMASRRPPPTISLICELMTRVHHGRLAHVLQRQGVVLALDVNDERARPEHPLDQLLADVDLGDPLQPQLHRVTPEDALAHQNPRGGQRHHVGAPADQASDQPQAGDQGDDEDRVVGPARCLLPQDHQHYEGDPHADRGEQRAEEEDPVGRNSANSSSSSLRNLPAEPSDQRTGGHRPTRGTVDATF